MKSEQILWAAVVLVAAGCGRAESGESLPEGIHTVSYEAEIQPIWDEHCMGCHGFHTPHLTAGESRKNLLDEQSWFECVAGDHVRYVVARKPDESFLLNRLTGIWPADVSGDCVRPMPADVSGVDTPLEQIDPEAVERIRTWIAEGAADN